MFKSTSTSMIWIGIAAIIAGIIALVILFAVYAFSDAILQGSRAFNSDNAGPVVGHLLLGLIDIAAGVVAIVWPGPTALQLRSAGKDARELLHSAA
jgi:uncharacterized membrane protein HdeD (DUF308 family)